MDAVDRAERMADLNMATVHCRKMCMVYCQESVTRYVQVGASKVQAVGREVRAITYTSSDGRIKGCITRFEEDVFKD